MNVVSMEFFKILMTSGLMFTLYKGRKTYQNARVLIRKKFKKSLDYERTYCNKTY
jgi:hypothetical protein